MKIMAKKIQKHKKVLKSVKFSSRSFIIDKNDHYKPDAEYNGVIGDVKKYTAHTKTARQRVTISTKGLYKGDPIKELTARLPGKDGRNNNGHITSGHTHTPYRRKHRIINIHRKFEEVAKVLRIEKDPSRTSFIAAVKDTEKRVYYIPATVNMKVGQKLECGSKADCIEGNLLPLENIVDGTEISNIEIRPNSGSRMVRAAGTKAKLIRKENGKVYIKLPSGETRIFSAKCTAYVGQVSNPNRNRIKLGSAGRAFQVGRRPKNNPRARNPVDHAMGGRSHGHRKSNFKGNMLHGQRTRSPRKSNSMIDISRHKNNE